MKEYPVLTAVTPLENYLLLLDYGEDGKRVYDFKPHLTHKYYRALADSMLFQNVRVCDGEIFWATGQDFCPNTLYEGSIPVE